MKHAGGENENMDKEINITEWCRAEAWFWMTMLQFCGKRMPLPDPDQTMPPWAVKVYTDSAGGSLVMIGAGMGAVIYPHWWV